MNIVSGKVIRRESGNITIEQDDGSIFTFPRKKAQFVPILGEVIIALIDDESPLQQEGGAMPEAK